MSRRRGSATALNASDVVAALAISVIYSYIGICQAFSIYHRSAADSVQPSTQLAPHLANSRTYIPTSI